MADIDLLALPALKDVIERFELNPRKSLGQNFILDPQLLAKIVRVAGNLENITVIEIGPGPGGLTRELLRHGAKQVIAIEYDPRAIAALQGLVEMSNQRLTVYQGDALTLDWDKMLQGPAILFGNLPYNIATPLLLKWLPLFDRVHQAVLMFQKEVADRLVAVPRTKDYGRLSVMTQWRASVEKCFDIGPKAFLPPPKVTSTVVRLRPKDYSVVPWAVMEDLLKSAFGQRRKMLRQSLKSRGEKALEALRALNIPETARAEELTVDQFVRLATILNDDET
jgi:16S rRNA (adenine1518-N6/adenine1519-N6)-dimethyltransferase